MVDLKKLSDRAKDLVEQRGGTEGLKEDAAQLREIAAGDGSLADKAKAAAAALKESGADPRPQADADVAPPAAPAQPAKSAAGAKKRAAEGRPKGERRKQRAERRDADGNTS